VQIVPEPICLKAACAQFDSLDAARAPLFQGRIDTIRGIEQERESGHLAHLLLRLSPTGGRTKPRGVTQDLARNLFKSVNKLDESSS